MIDAPIDWPRIREAWLEWWILENFYSEEFELYHMHGNGD